MDEEENEELLDEETVSHICMYMRIIDLFDKNEEIISKNPEIVEQSKLLRDNVKYMMELLTPEQQDYVLEVHKIQKEYLAKELEKENKKALKKKNIK